MSQFSHIRTGNKRRYLGPLGTDQGRRPSNQRERNGFWSIKADSISLRILLQASFQQRELQALSRDGTRWMCMHGCFQNTIRLGPGLFRSWSPLTSGFREWDPLSSCKWEWMTDPGSGREAIAVCGRWGFFLLGVLSHVQFCDPVDCSPPGSSIHGILQARILEWVAISSSRGSSWPSDRTQVSCIGRQILYHWAIKEALLSSIYMQISCSCPRPAWRRGMDVQNVNGGGHSSQENRSLAKFGNSWGILAKWNSPPCLWGRPNPYFAQEDYWVLERSSHALFLSSCQLHLCPQYLRFVLLLG